MEENLLQHYIRLVDFLGVALGPDYEVVLHDVTDSNNSIVAIANGYISNREIGAPLSNKALQLIADGAFRHSDSVLQYYEAADNGKLLRTNTFFIKSADDKLLGLLCINFDDSRYAEISTRILKLCHPDQFINEHVIPNMYSSIWPKDAGNSHKDEYASTVDAVIDSIIGRILSEFYVPIDRLTQDEKMTVLDKLNQQGLFRIKGSVSHVAKALCSSEASIYRYLSKLKTDKSESVIHD